MCNHIGQVNKLARKYYRAVKSNPWKFTGPCFEYQDLVQCGIIGLIKAMNKYDVNHSKKATFNTYAYWYIRVEITRHIENNASFVRIPVWKQSDHTHIVPIIRFDLVN